MDKKILLLEEKDSGRKLEFYDDFTYTVTDQHTGRVYCKYSKWKIKDGDFWFQHAHSNWSKLEEDHHFYPESRARAERLSIALLESVIWEE